MISISMLAIPSDISATPQRVLLVASESFRQLRQSSSQNLDAADGAPREPSVLHLLCHVGI